MDLTKIKSAVTNQLTGTNGIYSLKLQNHIYGCFIIMEDIAQHNIDVSGTTLSTSKFIFDCDKQFSEIGLRYGFAMDTKLALDTYDPEYKEAWISCFKDIDLSQDIDEVDKIEDCLIEVIQKIVISEEAFFVSALDTGTLPQEWIEKVLKLLNPVTPENDVEIEKTAIATATTEKPLRAKRRLATTRRAGYKPVTSTKKTLAKTRRHR